MAKSDNTGTRQNKSPNFLLIVILAGIFLVVGLLAAFFTIDWDGRRLVPRAFGRHAHPTSRLYQPASRAVTQQA